MNQPRSVVVGTGGWGSALATMLHRQGQSVTLLGRDPAKVVRLVDERKHPELGGASLPDDLAITADPGVLITADLVFWAVPTQYTRATAANLALPSGVPVVSLSKGLEQDTLETPTGILNEVLGHRPLAVLSGPSHAEEVQQGKPVVLACGGPEALTRQVSGLLHGRACRIYTSTDLIGIELSGALKNVIAVAAGITEGLGLGDNIKAALITRGLAEIRRLGRACGAQEATFAGIAGIGDLLTTCYSPHGRNRAVGIAIASGENPLAFIRRQKTVAEGAWTCRAAVELARKHEVELPIAAQVSAIIWDGAPLDQAIEALFARSPKDDHT